MTKLQFNKDLLLNKNNPVVVSCSTPEQWNNLISYMEDELGYKNWEDSKNEEHSLKYNVNVRLDMLESKLGVDPYYSVITYEDALLHTFTTNDNIDLTGINDTPSFSSITQFREDLLTNPNLVVNCRSENEAIELLTWADSKGLRWCTGSSYLESNEWNRYKEETCYNIYRGVFGDTKGEGFKNYTILSYSQALAIDRSQDEFQFQGHCHNLMSTGEGSSNECDAVIRPSEMGIYEVSTMSNIMYNSYMKSLKNEVIKQVGVPKDYLTHPVIVKSIHTPKLNFGLQHS